MGRSNWEFHLHGARARASLPSLDQRRGGHGCSVEQVAEAEAEAVEWCWSPAGEITTQWDENLVDEGEDEGDGGEDEGDNGACGHGEAGAREGSMVRAWRTASLS